MVNLVKVRRPEVCDSCLDVAYDNGFEGYQAQANVMMEMGADLPDHLCDAVQEPECWPVCQCGCSVNRRR
mgnify:CR=1 FL=1